MRTPERFWQWFDAERPTTEHAKRMAMENVSERGRADLEHAADDIADRAGLRRHTCAIRNALEHGRILHYEKRPRFAIHSRARTAAASSRLSVAASGFPGV